MKAEAVQKTTFGGEVFVDDSTPRCNVSAVVRIELGQVIAEQEYTKYCGARMRFLLLGCLRLSLHLERHPLLLLLLQLNLMHLLPLPHLLCLDAHDLLLTLWDLRLLARLRCRLRGRLWLSLGSLLKLCLLNALDWFIRVGHAGLWPHLWRVTRLGALLGLRSRLTLITLL